MNYLMRESERNLTQSEHSIIMPLVNICADKTIKMPEFFESVEDSGKVLEDPNVYKYFTPYKDTELITQFSGDSSVIRKINCRGPYIFDCLYGLVKENFKKDGKAEVIGKPDELKLQPVRNMMVNNRSIK